MTFKGLLKIAINEYRKQHEEKMYSIVQELLRTQRELQEAKEKLRILELNTTTRSSSSSEKSHTLVPTISLYVRYKEIFNQFYRIRQTITIEELINKLRYFIKIPSDRSVRLRLLTQDGLTTICCFDKELHRTLESYNEFLKSEMILSIEDNEQDDDQSLQSSNIVNIEQIYSFNQSDV